MHHKNNQVSFQDKGHFELEFEIKVENFDGSLTEEANPEMKVELLRFIMDDNQTAQAVQRQVLTKSRVITTTKPPVYITGMYSSVPNRSPCAFILFCLFSPACMSYLGLYV